MSGNILSYMAYKVLDGVSVLGSFMRLENAMMQSNRGKVTEEMNSLLLRQEPATTKHAAKILQSGIIGAMRLENVSFAQWLAEGGYASQNRVLMRATESALHIGLERSIVNRLAGKAADLLAHAIKNDIQVEGGYGGALNLVLGRGMMIAGRDEDDYARLINLANTGMSSSDENIRRSTARSLAEGLGLLIAEEQGLRLERVLHLMLKTKNPALIDVATQVKAPARAIGIFYEQGGVDYIHGLVHSAIQNCADDVFFASMHDGIASAMQRHRGGYNNDKGLFLVSVVLDAGDDRLTGAIAPDDLRLVLSTYIANGGRDVAVNQLLGVIVAKGYDQYKKPFRDGAVDGVMACLRNRKRQIGEEMLRDLINDYDPETREDVASTMICDESVSGEVVLVRDPMNEDIRVVVDNTLLPPADALGFKIERDCARQGVPPGIVAKQLVDAFDNAHKHGWAVKPAMDQMSKVWTSRCGNAADNPFRRDLV